jgi:hypothetical protein
VAGGLDPTLRSKRTGLVATAAASDSKNPLSVPRVPRLRFISHQLALSGHSVGRLLSSSTQGEVKGG